MIVAKKAKVEQPLLIDLTHERKITVAACRNYAGEFFEVATLKLFGGERILTDSRADVCPDLKIGPNVFLEVKSVGKNRAAMAYDSRLEKDRAFVEETQADLFYAFWQHGYRCKETETLKSLRKGLAKSVVSLTVVPFPVVYEVMKAGPVMTLNKARPEPRSRATGERRGYGSYGYTTGYRVRMTAFNAELDPRKLSKAIRPFGFPINGIDVFLTVEHEALSEMLRRNRF